MKLTYNALLHVISLTYYVKDSVQLMATCRVLYHEGPKIALKKAVFIRMEEQLTSFLKFLRADNSCRCRYLRQLELLVLSLEPDVIQELIEVLPLLTHIEYLCLANADKLLCLHPTLTPAFCALTTLRHIDFYGVKDVACMVLLRLSSPLISAKINFLSDDNQKLWDYLEDDEWKHFHPMMLLDNFAQTLEELQCIAWYTNQDALIPVQVYLNMRKLSIELHHFPIRIDALIHAFPYLTELCIMTEYHSGNVGTFSLEAMPRTLHSNLYAISLLSHICCVTIVDRLDDGPRMEMLAKVLRYAKPLHLRLWGITGTMLSDADRGFIAMLWDESTSNLISLDMRISFGEDDRERDLAAIIDTLVSSLTSLPLKFLELRFETFHLDLTPPEPSVFDFMVHQQKGLPEPPAPVPAPLTPAELSLKALDMDALIARLASMPSLEAAHIVFSGSRYEVDSQWRGHDRTIMKGTSCLAGGKQWESWIPGKNRIVLVHLPVCFS
ncbi:hypothetical protein V8D89_003654 [Ganoderma adspersum]